MMAILTYMPETQTLETVLADYEQKLINQLLVEEQKIRNDMEEFTALVETGKSTPLEIETFEKDITQAKETYNTNREAAEYKLATKRQTLMEPILTRLQNAIDEVRDELGYALILNTVDSDGVSIVLSGDPKLDITKAVMKKLGLKTEGY